MKFKKTYEIQLAPTLTDHWYEVKEGKRKKVSLGTFPSATTILKAYPQGAHLNKWIGENGWNESQRILKEAGMRGTKVHDAVERLVDGDVLWKANYDLDEWNRINSWINWYKEYNPQILGVEVALFSKKYGYAGRVDCVCIIDGKVTVIDWKTSASMYPHFPLQYASYANAIEENSDLKVDQTAGLQLTSKTQKGWKMEVYPDWKKDFEMFQTIKKVWEYDSKSKPPRILDLPIKLSI